jgi:hypothetical protein
MWKVFHEEFVETIRGLSKFFEVQNNTELVQYISKRSFFPPAEAIRLAFVHDVCAISFLATSEDAIASIV